MTDEVAEVDTGHQCVTIRAGQRRGATASKIGLQPLEDFLLRFHRLRSLLYQLIARSL